MLKRLINPFNLSILLTIVTFLLSWIYMSVSFSFNDGGRLIQFWYNSIWDLLAFSMQMMLILTFGYTIAISPFSKFIIEKSIGTFQDTRKLILCFTLVVLLLSLFNWALGLVFGAILAKRIKDHFQENSITINFPLICSIAYTSMMVWHGGLSGSAPLALATEDHFLFEITGAVPITDTILTPMNMTASVMVILCILIAVRVFLPDKQAIPKVFAKQKTEPRPQFDLFIIITGIFFLLTIIYIFVISSDRFRVINLNFMNFLLFGLALLSSGNLKIFTENTKKAVSDSTGILIQFPIYAGIMGLANGSGLAEGFTEFLVSKSSAETFPLITLFSAGVLNFFIPSGGGQWAIQGPILVDAARQLGLDFGKAVMAMAYGDQLTNMIQPFWALPLLGITKVEPTRLLYYTIRFMFIGALVYIIVLLLF